MCECACVCVHVRVLRSSCSSLWDDSEDKMSPTPLSPLWVPRRKMPSPSTWREGWRGELPADSLFGKPTLVDEATLCFLQRSRCSPWGG